MREYRTVLGEITTALFACPDCGAVVWYSLRGDHDYLHQRIDDQQEQLDADRTRLDELAAQIATLQSREP